MSHKHVQGTECAALVHMGKKIIACDECFANIQAFAKSGAVAGEIVMGPKLLSTVPVQKGRREPAVEKTVPQPVEVEQRRGPGRPRKDVA